MLRLAFFFWNLCLINILWAQADNANEGRRIIDEGLFHEIREKYNAYWPIRIDSEAKAEILQDSSILMEIDDKIAEAFFYNLNHTKEDIQYIPHMGTTLAYNYFNRLSENISCGFFSHDLKKDPFPRFKCRFRIDSEGSVYSFLDRGEVSMPNEYGGVWDDGLRDFYWRSVNEYKSEASAIAPYVFYPKNFTFTVYDKIASILYNSLNVNAQDVHWGPIPVKMKVGHQIWCAAVGEVSVGEPSGYKCHIGFEPNGQASHAN